MQPKSEVRPIADNLGRSVADRHTPEGPIPERPSPDRAGSGAAGFVPATPEPASLEPASPGPAIPGRLGQGRPAADRLSGMMAPRATRSNDLPSTPVVVKKYANRRLYNTESSCYVTLEDLAGMVRLGRDFVVYDAKSGEDITRGVLTQIIVEEESKGRHLLPESFLRQLIAFYGDSLQAVVPRYLEFAMAGFARQQDQMKRSMESAIGGFMPAFPGLEEMGKQNMVMLERAMALFTPFRPPDATREAPAREAGPAAAREPLPAGDPAPASNMLAPIEALNAEIDRLKQQLAALRQPHGGD